MAPNRTCRIAAVALAALVAMAAAGCGSSNDRHFRVTTYPPGARVKIGEEGRVEGQTPLESLHLLIPEDGTVLIVLEKEGYQTVAQQIHAESPDHLFICLERAPDMERILAALQMLKSSVDRVDALAVEIQRQLEAGRR